MTIKEKIDNAIKALIKYDYEMGKSAQDALWLIHEMQDIFEEKGKYKNEN